MNLTPSRDWSADITATCLYAELVPRRPWVLPPFPEVTLRGAVGRALIELVCHHDAPLCRDCLDRDHCIVPNWYDPGLTGSAQLRPFVLRSLRPPGSRVSREHPLGIEWVFTEPPPDGFLFHDALLWAVREGLGRERVQHDLKRMIAFSGYQPLEVLAEGISLRPWPAPGPLHRMFELPGGDPYHLTLSLETPFQLKKRKGLEPSAAALLDAAVNRLRNVARRQGISILHRWPPFHSVRGIWEDLQLERVSRFSSRQGERVNLDGWTGTIHLQGDLEPWAELLEAAQLLHLGRKTSFGLGRISLDWRCSFDEFDTP